MTADPHPSSGESSSAAAPSTDVLGRMFAEPDAVGMSEQQAAARVRAALLGGVREHPRLSRYRLERPLGSGAMGEVWLAQDPELSREVAIKIVRASQGPRGQSLRERLVREAQSLARLSHPNVVQIFDVGTYRSAQGEPSVFLVMELVDGETLAQWLTRPRPWRAVLEAYRQAGAGLAAAHAVGLVHRDFKPTNVFMGRATGGRVGRVRVGDFGLARVGDAPAVAVPSPHGGAEELADTHEGNLTETGAVVGTPLYMAPEQHRGETVDARSDQYAFCVSLYEALFRVRPFSGDLAQVLRAKLDHSLATVPAGTDVPPAVHDAVVRGLAPDPAQRWPTMTALLDALAPAGRRRRPLWLGLGTASLLLSGLALARVRGADACDGRDRVAHAWGPTQRTELASAVDSLDGAVDRGLLERALDAQADRLRDAEVAVCTAQPPAPAVARCVGAATAQFDATVQLLLGGSPAILRRAIAQIEALPDPTDCNDAQMSEVPEVPESLRAREAELAESTARVRALAGAGLGAEAVALALQVREGAQALGPAGAHLVRQVTYELGYAYDALGTPALAAENFSAAYFASIEAGDRLVAMRAANYLAGQVAERGRHDEAAQWLRHADSAAAGLELSSVDRGRRHQMIAVVAGYRGDLELAKREFAQVLAVCEQACPATHTTALSNLAVIAIREGDYEEALRLRQRAVDRAIEHDGADSVATAILRLGLAEALVETGQNEAAREEGMRARAVIERHEGPKQPELMREALVQYRVADAFGDKAGMVEHARRAVAIAEAVTAPDAPRRAIYYGTLGSALHVAGDYPGAERAFDQAFALLDDSDDGFQRAQLLIARGLMRIDAGDAARGLQDNRDARAIERARAHPDLQRITYTYGNEARALANLGDRTGAVEALEAGVAAFEREPGVRARHFAGALQAELAVHALELGDRARAIALCIEAARRVEPDSAQAGHLALTHGLALRDDDAAAAAVLIDRARAIAARLHDGGLVARLARLP
ncbi:MAG: protein kinase [Nannocystaceae bacterium]|nr:protein kinase [Nannocystaceae bacterium]